MNLKDLNLSDLVKIAITATAVLLLTVNLQFMSNNTTITNNYIQETQKQLQQQDKKLDEQAVKITTLQKATNETQGNLTQIESGVNKTLALGKSILSQVD